MNPKISLITAVYNVEKYLPKCLDSLVHQTLDDIEIICVDDGSTDKSAKILEDYAKKDSRIKVITQQNQGVAIARNVGLENASGKYIQFIDSDDWIDLDLCRIIYDIAERNDSDIVMFNAAFYDNNKKCITPGMFFNSKFWANHKDENTAHTFRDCQTIFYGNLSAANKLYRKSFLDEVGARFPEKTRFEDHLFHVETVFSARKINIYDRQMYYYRQNRKNSMMTSLNSTKVVFDIFKIVDMVEDALKRIGVFEEVKYLFFQFKYEAFAHYYMRVNLFSKPKYYKEMKERLFKMYYEDYDFTLCKKMANFYNFTDVLNYNWFVCFLLKTLLDNPKHKFRQKFEPVKKILENGIPIDGEDDE